MIVTRSWLEEFIDLSDISNETLYKTFNDIGLEVDSLTEITIPEKVVVGKVLSCEKHPDADKLNVCQIDTGDGVHQIVCGAANVVDAEYVAVATIGAVLPGDFKIKPAKLRGVDSAGMVCSSSELGLPEIGDGIMILDHSIGELEAGRELASYPKVADTIIELELTANRGDCLSIHGVARDLSAVFQRAIIHTEYKKKATSQVAIARKLSVHNRDDLPVDLAYKLSESDCAGAALLVTLRLGMIGAEITENPANILRYVTHATGVVLRAYDVQKLREEGEKISLDVTSGVGGSVVVTHAESLLSAVGIMQGDYGSVEGEHGAMLFEASYIHPDNIIEVVAEAKLKTDELYYRTSRGSEPDLLFGLRYLERLCDGEFACSFAENSVTIENSRQEKMIMVGYDELDDIIGQSISRSDVGNILVRLGFEIHRGKEADVFGAVVPFHRHDIENGQDIAEEILRIVGINNIAAKPLWLEEKNRLGDTTRLYRVKRDIRQRAAAVGFFEAVTYAFSDKSRLEKGGFETVDESLQLVNPIAEELSGLRTTLLTNLLEAARRNTNYGIKRIPLFEIGPVFDAKRSQSEKMAFVWSGQGRPDSVVNQGKPEMIDFAYFMERITAVIGEVSLTDCSVSNQLIHPYQSATIWQNGAAIGYLSKLHPEAAEAYGIGETFIAELDFGPLMPKHLLAKPISNFQGVFKDLSIVVDRTLSYAAIETILGDIDHPMLKRFYPVDIYEDEALGTQKSVSIRFFIQSMEGTLSDEAIETLMQEILDTLAARCGAKLR